MMVRKHDRPHRRALDSIATKLIVFVFCSTFVTALIVSWISIQATYAAQSEHVDRHLSSTAAVTRDQLDAWISAHRDELLGLAAALEAPIGKSLGPALATTRAFVGLTVQGGDGEIRGATGVPLPAHASRSGRTGHGLRAIRGDDGGHAIALAVPLDPTGDGLLLGILRDEEIAEVMNGRQTGAEATALLVDAAGHVLLGPGSPEAIIPLGDFAVDQARGAGEYTNHAGTAVIARALPVGLSDWSLVIESPFEVVFAPVVSAVKRTFVIDVCIILLFSLLAYKITTTILQPIDALSDGARRIAQGQLDHEIPEPVSQDEIGLLIHTFNDMMRELRGNHGEIEAANAELLEKNLQLQQANEVLEQLSITDGLTKLHNHRFFQDHLTREIKRVDRMREPLSMILIDIDDFKALNDRLGHAAGDELLRRIATLMNDSVRESDLLARYGGDEFVILTTNTDLAGARGLAEKIRTNVAESSFIVDESLRPIRTTLSMGVAQYFGTRKRFFSAADQALYRAKAEGKNCVGVDESCAGPC